MKIQLLTEKQKSELNEKKRSLEQEAIENKKNFNKLDIWKKTQMKIINPSDFLKKIDINSDHETQWNKHKSERLVKNHNNLFSVK